LEWKPRSTKTCRHAKENPGSAKQHLQPPTKLRRGPGSPPSAGDAAENFSSAATLLNQMGGLLVRVSDHDKMEGGWWGGWGQQESSKKNKNQKEPWERSGGLNSVGPSHLPFHIHKKKRLGSGAKNGKRLRGFFCKLWVKGSGRRDQIGNYSRLLFSNELSVGFIQCH